MSDKQAYWGLAAVCVVCGTVLLALGQDVGGMALVGAGTTIAGRGKS